MILQSSPLFQNHFRNDKVEVSLIPDVHIDADRCYASFGTLKRLNCMSNSWITLFCGSKERSSQLNYDESIVDDYIHVKPSFLFNLQFSLDNSSKNVDNSKVFFKLGGTWLSNHPRRITQDGPPYASSITIARIKSPESSGHEDYSKYVRNYFESDQRIVRIGDVLPVQIEEELIPSSSSSSSSTSEQMPQQQAPMENQQDSNSTAATRKQDDGENSKELIDLCNFGVHSKVQIPHPIKFVYFQVTNVLIHDEDSGNNNNSSSYRNDVLIDPSTTTLKQVGAVHSHIPDVLQEGGGVNINYDNNDNNNTVEQRVYSILFPTFSSKVAVKPNVSLLLSGPRGSGKRSSIRIIAKKCFVHLKQVSLTTCRGLPQDRVVEIIEDAFQEAFQVSPCILLFSNFESIIPLAGGGKEKPDDPDVIATTIKKLVRSRKQPVVATTLRLEDIPAVLRGCFTHEIEYSSPDRSQRMEFLSNISENLSMNEEVNFDELSMQTGGRNFLELKCLLSNAGQIACLSNSNTVRKVDITKALDSLPNAMDELSAAAPKIPEVRWDDVGGLGHAKDEILDMIQLPLQRPDLFASGMKSRSGILLFGPPGTGKTLLAKAIATECSMNFISVKGPELLDMYIGESERKVRQVFETARAAKPCVLFFDELDSLAPQRGRGSDSGGVMDRVVSQLLTEIDGMQSKSGEVFVIGATNRPDLLDSSLLRPGRFDRLIYLGISKDRSDQVKIVKALTRKYKHAPDVDLMKVLENAPLNLTGADFYALSSNAMSNAIRRRVLELSEIAKQKNIQPRKLLSTLSEEELQVFVSMHDYQTAMNDLVPSVSEKELLHYEALRIKFSNNTQQKPKNVPEESTIENNEEEDK